jgi:hypothetical protein
MATRKEYHRIESLILDLAQAGGIDRVLRKHNLSMRIAERALSSEYAFAYMASRRRMQAIETRLMLDQATCSAAAIVKKRMNNPKGGEQRFKAALSLLQLTTPKPARRPKPETEPQPIIKVTQRQARNAFIAKAHEKQSAQSNRFAS